MLFAKSLLWKMRCKFHPSQDSERFKVVLDDQISNPNTIQVYDTVFSYRPFFCIINYE